MIQENIRHSTFNVERPLIAASVFIEGSVF
jgi:hypothetical protein